MNGLLMVLLFLTSVFLILLVLVQRGRGGGLAGAFGGLGGQSAFGTKAGDLFTRVTIVTATFWIVLCAFSVKWFSDENRSVIAPNLGANAASTPVSGGTTPSNPSKPGATGPGKAAGEAAPATETKQPAGATEPAPPADAEKAK